VNFANLIDELSDESASDSFNVMLLIPSINNSTTNMVFSKARTWDDDDDEEDSEREKNNNIAVKNNILRTTRSPSRCTLAIEFH